VEQKKASEIMAERLPGLIDPNLPPEQQPRLETTNPDPVTRPPQALHPDRFTPGGAAQPKAAETPSALPQASPESSPAPPAAPKKETQP
jgi:rod shape-determining protein MreC